MDENPAQTLRNRMEKRNASWQAAQREVSHNLGETSYGSFKPFGMVISKAIQDADLRRKNFTAGQIAGEEAKTFTMREATSWIEQLSGELDKLGLKRVSSRVMAGSFALTFETNDHQMIRIANAAIEHPRGNHPYMLKPLITYELKLDRVENQPAWKEFLKNRNHYKSEPPEPAPLKEVYDTYYVEVMPKVHTLYEIVQQPDLAAEFNIADVDATAKQFIYDLMVDARKQKHMQFFYDPCMDNIGVIKDKNGKAVPVILDAGAVVDYDRVEPGHWLQFADHAYKTPLLKGLKVPEFVPRLTAEEIDSWEKKYAQQIKERDAELALGRKYTKRIEHVPQKYLMPLISYVDGLKKAPDTGVDYVGAQEAHWARMKVDIDEPIDIRNTEQQAAAENAFIAQREGYKGVYDKQRQQFFDPEQAVGLQLMKEGVSTSEMLALGKAERPGRFDEPEPFCNLIRRGAVRDGILPGK